MSTELCWQCLGAGTVDKGGVDALKARQEPCRVCNGEGHVDLNAQLADALDGEEP